LPGSFSKLNKHFGFLFNQYRFQEFEAQKQYNASSSDPLGSAVGASKNRNFTKAGCHFRNLTQFSNTKKLLSSFTEIYKKIKKRPQTKLIPVVLYGYSFL
jgi:hypothetical protein